MTNFLIGRQPIFNRKLEIYAYEILFRGHEFNLAQESQATQATNQIVTDTILELGINQLVESHKAFINFTGQNILEKNFVEPSQRTHCYRATMKISTST